MEGRINARRQQCGGQIQDIMQPVRGIRDEIKRRGGVPKDHVKENYQRLKQIERTNRDRKQELAKPPPSPFKLKEFERVLPRTDSGLTPSATPFSTRPSSVISDRGSQTSINHIYLNKQLSKIALDRTHRPSPKSAVPARKLSLGSMPQYLITRNDEMAKAQSLRLRKLSEPVVPPGHVAIKDHERIECLKFLKHSHGQLLNSLSRLPITMSSSSTIKQKTALDHKLRECERAIEMFSKPKVLIPESMWNRLRDDATTELENVRENEGAARRRQNGMILPTREQDHYYGASAA